MPAGPTVHSGMADPDHCALLPEPGTDDPIIEIRHDIGALFVLLDVDGELVVIRASSEATTAPATRRRLRADMPRRTTSN